MSVVEDASAASLHGFLQSKVELGSVISTDAWRFYQLEGVAYNLLKVRRLRVIR